MYMHATSSLVCFQFKEGMIDTLYRFAKFQYECGNYSGAAEYLYFVRVLVRIFKFFAYTLSLPLNMVPLFLYHSCHRPIRST